MSLARARGLMEALDQTTVARYTDYIESIRPRNPWQVAKRWIFAFCSIHTTWESNVAGYLAVTALGPAPTQRQITGALQEARTGLHVNKGRAIHAFLQDFWSDPKRYSFENTTRVKALRDALTQSTCGIGLAKTSFACEMINPAGRLVCLDTHVLQWLHGHSRRNGNMGAKRYRLEEAKWLAAAAEYGYNPVAARHATWDKAQGQTDMRYWSHVLEE